MPVHRPSANEAQPPSAREMSVLPRKPVALIPAKARSGRLPEKNFRPFVGGKSLLEIKIEQCLASGAFDCIYVSSDSEAAAGPAARHDVQFILRDPRFARDDLPWSEALAGMLDELPVKDDSYVAIVPVTTPLFHRFEDALALLGEDGRD
ncbi:MAG TPA: hypothetical protein VI381_00285, partial [Allosphingosinicella sp.]